MKFGQNLPRNQVPEWSSSYINYKGLKKLIKSAQKEESAEGGADLAEFFYALDRCLEDVDAFYNKKYAEFSRRLRLLYERYGTTTKVQEGMDKEELEDLMGALLELRSQYRKLQWYGEVNRRGFVKITKKLDKKISASSAQSRYLATKVDPKAFASNFRLTNDMRAINDWLSALAEVKIFDDKASVHSTGSLQRTVSRNAVRIPGATLDSLDAAVRQDSVDQIKESLDGIPDDLPEHQRSKLLLSLVHRAITCKATNSITHLLSTAGPLEEEDDMNKRNIIHRYIISVGRARVIDSQNKPVGEDLLDPVNFIPAAEFPRLAAGAFKVEERDVDKTLGKAEPSIKLLVHILKSMKPEQRSALLARDMYGRLPLHYAAQYGLVAASQELVKHMQDWDQFDVSQGIDSAYWQDTEGYAPLHLSVLGGHYRTTKALLLAENWQHEHDEDIHARQRVDKSGSVLMLATKSRFFKIVRLLVEAGVSVNYQDEQGETALHVAARFGYEDCMVALLEGSDIQKPNLELAEKTFGWTPIFVACVDGQPVIVDLLLSAGAQVDRADVSGWKPIEHAALRGHLIIAQKLADLTTDSASDSPPLRPVNGNTSVASSLGDRTSNGLFKDVNAARPPEPVKTFGHRYLANESLVLVSLGSMDARKDIPAVKLENVPLASAHSTQLDTALSIVVSAIGAKGEPTIIDLPVQENISTSPITFTSSDPTKVKVLFDIVPTHAGTKDKVLGRGVAMLNTIRPGMGSKRISLQGDLSVPIVAADTLDVIGTANFNFLIITPFSHPNMTITENKTYWKRTSTQIIGHRGLGKNMAAMKSLQLGENTIPSFIAASNLGASYVEFDVQLTKDLVPVIYHDFLVSETGIDAPVHTLTLEQFLHANEGSTSRQSRPASPTTVNGDENGGRKGRTQRSYSLGASEEDQRVNMDDRMKHTRDYKQKGFKANSRGNFIQAPFATLEDMFKKLPEGVGFNIEMKYPMLFESEEQEMDTYAVELNSFVDTVLTKVYELGKGRNIIFSSFHPDICLLLSFKQPSIPVLFLTDAGTAPVGDIRASSLQEAIRFASRWNLLGIVSAATPLVMCPRLVKVVRQSGLLCFSYGTLNNDPKNVARQAKEGIDAVIVDSVLAVRKGLTATETVQAVGEEVGRETFDLREGKVGGEAVAV
ncbi:Glycerophosphocholine phosphodiesterase GDE1-like protein [Elsinoe fawcettii]|nr:Glycerophosphocholine phosphodiesterase GDE1-like protein [Elsinoe fawcettii]